MTFRDYSKGMAPRTICPIGAPRANGLVPGPAGPVLGLPT